MALAGYKYLRSYQMTMVIYDLTIEFAKLWIDPRSRTKDQMEQAARSGKQNILEGYLEKSLKSYIYLAGVAYASLGELSASCKRAEKLCLLEDYEDFLRQHQLEIWSEDNPKIREFRGFRVEWISPNSLNTPKLPPGQEEAANLLITLIHQAQFLLARQLASLEEKFVKEGGFTENLHKKRLAERNKKG